MRGRAKGREREKFEEKKGREATEKKLAAMRLLALENAFPSLS